MPEPGTSAGLAEELRTLPLCGVALGRSHSAATAAGWSNRLLRLGISLPLFVVHDVGWLISAPRDELHIGAKTSQLPPDLQPLVADYLALLGRLADSPLLQQASELRLRDELVAVLLARLFSQLATRYAGQFSVETRAILPLDPALYAQPVGAVRISASARQFLAFLLEPESTLHLLTAVELIDIGMLRLLSAGTAPTRESLTLFTDGSQAGVERLDLVDLLQATLAPETRDIVRFSLDLLPSVLETRRSAGSQYYPVGGYAALERRGSLDAVLKSELLYDEDLFFARLSENELLFYGRERRHEESRGEHQILIDASASMHGLRQVFARGLAIALCQKLILLGGKVRLRFFDGRLHEAISPTPNLGAALPYLLSFRGTRGRHYARVFSDLLRELQQNCAGSGRAKAQNATERGLFLHILTHGECHIPVETVQALGKLCQLHGVFLLPSGDLMLDYLPLLQSHSVITDEALEEPAARRARALGIVEKL